MPSGPQSRLRVVTLVDRLGVRGGAERLAMEVLIGLDPCRFERTLCVSRWSTQRRDAATERELERLAAAGVRFLGLSRSSRAEVAAWRPLVSHLRRERTHVLHSHKHGSNAWAPLLARLGGTPVVIAHEHTWSYQGRPLRRFIDRAIVARGSDAFVAVSREDQRRMVAVERIPLERTVFIPNGIRTRPSRATRQEIRAELGLDPDDQVAAVVGFLWPAKAIDVLLDAVATLRGRLPRLRVLIVGDGEQRDALESKAESLSLGRHVRFLGFRSDIPEILAGCDFAIMSSDREGSPLSVLEYMAAGLPVVATRVGGVPDLIEDGVYGHLVPPRDPERLADAIAQLLTNPAAAAAMGERARERQRREFDLDATITLIEELYLDRWSRKRPRQ